MTGLDIVDVVMSAETTFHISLWSPDAQEIATVGQLCDRIVQRIEEKQQASSLENYLFMRLRDALRADRPATGEEVGSSTALARIIPPGQRRAVWDRLRYRTGETLPALRRPWVLRLALMVAAIVLGWICTFGLMFDFHPERMISRPLAAIGCLFFFVPAAALVALLGLWCTAPLALVLPRGVRTVGDLVKATMAINYGSAEAAIHWRREEIWTILQEIILDIVPVDASKITREARLIEDLCPPPRMPTTPGTDR